MHPLSIYLNPQYVTYKLKQPNEIVISCAYSKIYAYKGSSYNKSHFRVSYVYSKTLCLYNIESQ